MSRFIEEDSRQQTSLFPERLDEYIGDDNPVRVIDAFVDGLDLRQLEFERAVAKATGLPGYKPSTLLKLYIYGYLNRIQSSRRLEKESQRNVELMWLLGRLQPDFKTIADFRTDNSKAIRHVCREFVSICRKLDLFEKSLIAIDGSKFKAVNSKQKNDTQASMKRRIASVEKHIEDYLKALADKDSDDNGVDERTVPQVSEKLAALQGHLEELKQRAVGSMVGYNVQTAVDSDYKLIVAHEVTNSPVDRSQILPIARLAQDALGRDGLTVLADRGYYKGSEIKSCVDEGMVTLIPRSLASNNGADGLFPRTSFRYDAQADEYRCPTYQLDDLLRCSDKVAW